MKTYVTKKKCTNVHSSTIPNSQEVETIHLSINKEGVKKMWYVHKMKHCSAGKRNKVQYTLQHR